MRDIKDIEERYRNRKPRGSITLRKWYLIIPVLLIAFIVNPNEEQHKKEVKSRIEKATFTSLPANNLSDYETGNMIIDQLTDRYITSTNYIFFSTTNITWQGQTHTIGLGVFGHVFLSGNIDNYLK
ncbi:MAG: hypothetical protein E6767_01530 [Dysgonomonas sp.]|nr:hypothetical protein [Dysgonomonas sp.]